MKRPSQASRNTIERSAKRCRQQEPLLDAYRKMLKTLAQVSDGCRSYIVRTLKESLKELDNVYFGRENVIEECMAHLDVYIKIVTLCEQITDCFDLAYEERLKTREIEIGCFSLVAPIHDILTEYYQVSDYHSVEAPHPWPKTNLKLRLYLKRISELPYFLHRDMTTVIRRFLQDYPSVKLTGIRSVYDCFTNIMDDYCGMHWLDMNALTQTKLSKTITFISSRSGSCDEVNSMPGIDGIEIHANDERFKKIQAELPPGHVLF